MQFILTMILFTQRINGSVRVSLFLLWLVCSFSVTRYFTTAGVSLSTMVWGGYQLNAQAALSAGSYTTM